ncbi:MAG: spore coat protein CotH [Crocinitomicaceae bacterium]|jgi:spore coat protein CotH
MKYKKYIIGLITIVAIVILYIVLSKEESNSNSINPVKKEAPIRVNSELSYKLDIDPSNFKVLEDCRLKAIKKGVLTDDNQPYVKGILTVNESKYDVKVKLKGALRSHWVDPVRWSFRVIIKDGVCLENGLKVFSIQSGTQRGNLVEVYYHHFLKSNGLIHMNYSNINFSLNGKFLNNYALEEFFDTPLLANNNKVEGPILKFVFDDYWESVDWMKPDLTVISIMETFDKTYHTAPLKSFKFKSGRKDNWRDLTNKAIEKLDEFRNGSVKARDVFDLKLMGKYFAVNTLFGSQHPAFATNIRFYYNPTTELIEPIGYDMEVIRDLTLANEKDRGANYWPNKVSLPLFTAQLFSDPEMQSSYMESLTEISEKSDPNKLAEVFKEEILFFKKLNANNFDDHIKMLQSNLVEIKSELEKQK